MDEYLLTLKHEMTTGWWVNEDEGGEDFFLPRSQCEVIDQNDSDGTITLQVPEWLAIDKGLA